MTGATPRVLFHSPSRRGLGHVMRSANLARATMAADAGAEVLVQVSNPAAGEVLGTDVPWVSEDHTARGGWARIIRKFQPTLVVFDTLLPGAWAIDDTPRAFVWRRCVPERHRAILEDERLRQMRLVVVPHARDEVDYYLPDPIAQRTVYAGPIVRPSTEAGRERVRQRYALNPTDVVVTSTLGGGGFEDSARWLLDAVLAAHDALMARVPEARHILVLGPLSGLAPPPPRPGLTVVETEPHLVDLFAVSDLVVAEAGYNTVHEIRQVQVPALFFPGERTFDDQMLRASDLASKGVARAMGRTSLEAAAHAIVELAADHEAKLAMRVKAAQDGFATGNRAAAEALLEAAR